MRAWRRPGSSARTGCASIPAVISMLARSHGHCGRGPSRANRGQRICAASANSRKSTDRQSLGGTEMGQVSVPVNGRSYAITCDDGQETRIRRLAQYVDAKVAEFVGSVGQAGEARLLLLAALVIADELSDANDALERERNRAENASNGRDETAGRG